MDDKPVRVFAVGTYVRMVDTSGLSLFTRDHNKWIAGGDRKRISHVSSDSCWIELEDNAGWHWESWRFTNATGLAALVSRYHR